MGYIRNKMTVVHDQRSINPYDFATDNEVQSYKIFLDCTSQTQSVFTYTLKEAVRVVDAYAVVASPVAGTNVQVKDNDGNGISSRMLISTDSAVVRTATLHTAHWDESKGNVLQAVQSGLAASCYIFIEVVANK